MGDKQAEDIAKNLKNLVTVVESHEATMTKIYNLADFVTLVYAILSVIAIIVGIVIAIRCGH